MYKGATQNYSQHWLELVKYLDLCIKLDNKNILWKSGQSISILVAGSSTGYLLLWLDKCCLIGGSYGSDSGEVAVISLWMCARRVNNSEHNDKAVFLTPNGDKRELTWQISTDKNIQNFQNENVFHWHHCVMPLQV